MSKSMEAPAWLEQARSQSYIASALRTLTSREFTRTEARDVSRNRAASRPSDSHRFRLSTLQAHVSRDLVNHYSVTAGFLPKNQDKNRYLQLEPYDRTRVVVGGNSSDEGEAEYSEGRYLNANWVQERFGQRWWIASQAPLPHTAHAFLTLFRERVHLPRAADASTSNAPASVHIRTVVQLTQNVESGRCKAHAYFPLDPGVTLIVPPEEGCHDLPYKVTLVASQEHESARCIQNTVSFVPVAWARPHASTSDDEDGGADNESGDIDENGLTFGEEVGEQVTFTHLLYAAWPDHGVPRPEDRASLLAFIRLVHSTNVGTQSLGGPKADPDPPIIVGCSAGIGRTGSFIALSSLLRVFNLIAHPADSTTHPASSINTGSSPKRFLPSIFRKETSTQSSIEDSPVPAHLTSPLGPLPETFKDDLVVQEVDALREQRPGMVQRDEQVLLIYSSLFSAFQTASDSPA
ncbi:hypothetical protein HGRIS_008530 [Hohenbuehelia grisea]|uniref:Phosphatases II n=1 Tax=Hohenbuehelia grisea TaxID=104357 RepID=A0ABR3J8R1_9AGAR